MRWFRDKSFVVRMVNTNDVDKTEETVVIDVDKTVDKTVQAVLILMGAYMTLSTVRQLIVGHPEPAQIINTISPIFNNNNSSNVLLGGPLRKIVECVETGEKWETLTEAARVEGVPIAAMSRHCNRYTDHINHKHFRFVGVGLGN